MTSQSNVFGSYGRRQDANASFDGKRLFGGGRRTDPDRPPFGKRVIAPVPEVSLAEERLLDLQAELTLVFQDMAFPRDALPFSYHEDEDVPHVRIAPAGIVRVDQDSGAYAFSDETSGNASLLVTTSHERLIEAILSHLAAETDARAPVLATAIIVRCVGNTVADVEKSLILATLRHCNGNRTHASQMLGISLRTLRNKLRSYWQGIPERNAAKASHIST